MTLLLATQFAMWASLAQTWLAARCLNRVLL